MFSPTETLSQRGSLQKSLHDSPCNSTPKLCHEACRTKQKQVPATVRLLENQGPCSHRHWPTNHPLCLMPLTISSYPHSHELTEICLYSTWAYQVCGPYWLFPGTSVTRIIKKSLANQREMEKNPQLFTRRQELSPHFLTSTCTITTPWFHFIIMGHFPIWNCLLTWTDFLPCIYI